MDSSLSVTKSQAAADVATQLTVGTVEGVSGTNVEGFTPRTPAGAVSRAVGNAAGAPLANILLRFYPEDIEVDEVINFRIEQASH